MNNIKVVSFYTPNGIYQKMSERLYSSCIEHGVAVDIEQRQDLGSWVKNCSQKAEYILKKILEVQKNECIIWLDSDSKVIKTPDLFYTIKEEFAIRARPGPKVIKPVGREQISLPVGWVGDPAWFESGTIFARHTDSIITMLKLWIDLGQNNNRWDQWTLQDAWTKIKPSTVWLPQSYCQIHKLHGDKDAVILHDLASVIQKVNRL